MAKKSKEQPTAAPIEVEVSLRETLEKEYANRLATEVEKISQQMTEENKKVVTEAIERIRKEMTPPTEENIQKLLEQEYVEFTMEIPIGKNGDRTTRKFVIRELPQRAEKKLYATIKKILVPMSQDLAALSMNMLKGDAAEKLIQLMNTFEPAMDAMVVVTTVALNPYEEDKEINEDWVRDNLSSTRILKVVTAQVEANKMRDFLSLLFRGMRMMTTD